MTSTDHPHLTTTLTTTTHSPHAPTTHHQAHDLHRSPMQPHNSYIPSPCSPCNLTTHQYHNNAAHVTSQLIHTTISMFSSSIPTKPTSLSISSTVHSSWNSSPIQSTTHPLCNPHYHIHPRTLPWPPIEFTPHPHMHPRPPHPHLQLTHVA